MRALAFSLLALPFFSLAACSSADFTVATANPDGSVDDTSTGGDSAIDGTTDDAIVSGDTPAIESSPPTEAGPPPGSDVACHSFAEGVCTRTQACSPFALQVAYGTIDDCKTGAFAACMAFIGLPGVGTTPKKLGDCATAYADSAYTCDQLLSGVPPSACVVPGTRPTGASCANSAQCQSNACEIATGASCGQCVAGTEGSTCATTCSPGLKCVKGECTKYQGLAANCDSGKPCFSTMSCVAGKCSPSNSSVGAPCTPAGATIPTTADCDFFDGLYCGTNPSDPSSSTKTCVALGVSSPDQSCGVVGNRVTVCTGGDSCVTAGATDASTCKADLALGDTCTGASGAPQCSAFARCIQGKCALLDPTGCP